ncbi:copper resistance CopC/CopD family protein [Cellulomonas sp. P5_E12]
MSACDPGQARGRRRHAARALAVLTCVLLAVVLAAPAAQAHAVLVRSDPASGSILAASPADVTLWFDEEVSHRLSTARLVADDGETVPGVRVAPSSDDARVLALALPRLGSGTYGVLWQVLAEDDGHTSSGTVVFTVGTPTTAPVTATTQSAGPTPLAVALRWGRIAALAALVGALTVLLLVVSVSARTDASPALGVTIRTARGRLLVLGIGAASFGVLLGVADLAEQVRLLRPPSTPWASTAGELLVGSRWGHLLVAREIALVAAALLLVAVRSRTGTARRSRALTAAAVLATLALAGIEALGSHAAAVEGLRVEAIAADAVHVLAACLWLGAVAALGVVLWPHASGASGVELARACRGPFTRLVLVSVAVVLVTGLYGAGVQIASVDGLVRSAYGRTLLVKLGVVAVLLGLGFRNSTSLHGSRALGALRPFSRRLVWLEAGVGAVLLVAVGVLVETSPRADEGATPAASAEVVSGSAADVVVTVAATPSRPGLNGFAVTVASTRRPAPAPVDGVRLTLTSGGATSVVELQEVGENRYFGTSQVRSAGVVRVDAVVDRGGASLSVPLSWRVDAAVQPADTTVARPLAPYTDGLALLLVLGAVVAAAVHRRSVAGRVVEAEPVPVPTSR